MIERSKLGRSEKAWVLGFALVAFLSRVVLIFRPQWEFSPVGDDAFYVFSVARHLALGHGPTVDGSQLTNGFQPLIVLLYTPIFWLCGSDSWLAVKWSFVLAGVIAAASVWLVVAVIREIEGQIKNFAPLLGAFLWTFSIAVFMYTTNGLETGLYSMLLLWTMLAYVRIARDENGGKEISLGRWMWLGVLLGLTVLARIDATLLVVILTLYEVVRSRPITPIGPIVAASIVLAISSPWWIFNWVNFGSLMPTSGQAENLWPVEVAENIHRALQALTDIALLIVYAPDSMGLALRAVLALVLATLIVVVVQRTDLVPSLKGTRLRALFPFALFYLTLIIYYTFFFKAPHFIARFLQPLRMLWLIVVAISVPLLLEIVSKSGRRITLALLATITLVFGVDRYVKNFFMPPKTTEFYDTGMWALTHPDEKIGMLQSGIASFIAPNIINLDGKVNTEALRAEQRGRLAEYIRDERFTYLADWKSFVEDIAAICRKEELFFDSVGMIDRVQLMRLRRLPFDSPPRTH